MTTETSGSSTFGKLSFVIRAGAAESHEGPQGSGQAPGARAVDRGLHVGEAFGESDALVDQPLALHLVSPSYRLDLGAQARDLLTQRP